jgi:hypothetical protein
MIRTQISLDKTTYSLAKSQSKSLGISLAEFFRRALAASLPASKTKPWMKYCGDLSSGDTNASQTVDDIVYGSKD